MTLKYPGFSLQVHLCFMQQYNQRNLFISGSKGYLTWDQEGNRLRINRYENNEKQVLDDPDFSNDGMFFAQARHFLKGNEPVDTRNYLAAARDSLAIVEAAKNSMERGTDVTLPVPREM